MLAATLFGCTIDLEVTLEPEEEVLAAYAFVNCSAEASTVIVESSITFNEAFGLDDSKLAGPAQVQLFREGELWAEYRQQGGSVFYKTSHLPVGREQVEWEIVVSHPDFGEGRAKSRPPVPGILLSASLKQDYPFPDGGQAADALEIKIQDPPGVRNYYEIALLDGPADSLETIILNRFLLYATGDTAFIPASFFPLDGRWLVSDEAGDGEVLTLAFSSSVSREALQQPLLNIRYVPEAYYEYLKSLAGSGEQALEPFQLAQRGYSNFENILGVFALYLEERAPVD